MKPVDRSEIDRDRHADRHGTVYRNVTELEPIWRGSDSPDPYHGKYPIPLPHDARPPLSPGAGRPLLLSTPTLAIPTIKSVTALHVHVIPAVEADAALIVLLSIRRSRGWCDFPVSIRFRMPRCSTYRPL